MDTSLQSDRDRGPVRYARALLISAAAIALRLVLDPLLGVWHAQLGLIVAVALSAAWCGTGPAILALVVTAVASWGLFVLPHADLANAPTPRSSPPSSRSPAAECSSG
jgi:K+-sensing histidine kinase KdpD